MASSKSSPRRAANGAPARKRKKKTPKVRLSAKKVCALAISLCVLCVSALVIDGIAQGRKTDSPAPVSAERARGSEPAFPGGKTSSSQKDNYIEEKRAAERKSAQKEAGETVASAAREETPLESRAGMKAQNPAQNEDARKNPPPAASGKAQTESPLGAERKTPALSVPKAKAGAEIVLVIDDAGRSEANTRLYAALPFPLTIAVLPKLPETKACAKAVVENGKELILHQPMQAMNRNLDPGPGAVTEGMAKDEILRVVSENVRELGEGVKGMNNHEGSLITADFERIGYVLDACAENGIYFLDSRTTAETQAVNAAFARGMEIFEKSGPYIDNEISREKMLERLCETMEWANRRGTAVVIAHVDKSARILPALLEELYPEMKKAGYTFSTLSRLR